MSTDVRFVAGALAALGCQEVRIVSDEKVIATCPRPYRHENSQDWTPSYAVLVSPEVDEEGRRSVVGVCLGCHLKEPLEITLLWHQFRSGKNMSQYTEPLVTGDDKPQSRVDRIMGMDFDESSPRSGRWTDILSLDDVEYDSLSEKGYAKFTGSVPRYALDRGLTVETCAEWELGHDKKRGRLLFPARNRDGLLVGVTGRLYREAQICPRDLRPLEKGRCPRCGWKRPRKYLHSKGKKRKRWKWRALILYGEHKLTEQRVGLVTEGNFDVLMPRQAGVDNVVGILGSYVSDVHIMKMAEWWDDVWLWGDPDEAGRKMEEKVIAELEARGTRVHQIVDKPQDGDPGELPPRVILEALKRSGYPVLTA